MSREEILRRVGRIVSEVLTATPEEMILTVSLQDDMGAESIDYLKILSSRTSGRVVWLGREVGDRVKAGEVVGPAGVQRAAGRARIGPGSPQRG